MTKNFSFIGILLLFSHSVFSEKQVINIGEVAFEGKLTVAEVVEKSYQDAPMQKNDKIKIEVTIAARKQGEKSELDLSGLPGGKDTTMTIEIPFYSYDHLDQEGFFDVFSMADKIDEVLSNINHNQQDGLLYEKSCGGFPENSSIAIIEPIIDSQNCLDSITEVYQCQILDGQANWYFTLSNVSYSSCIES